MKNKSITKSINLKQRFIIISLLILLVNIVVIGIIVSKQIELGVINRISSTTALYVDSFVAPNIQEYDATGLIKQENISILNSLLENTALGKYIVSFRIWSSGGEIIYSTNHEHLGLFFPLDGGLRNAFNGEVSSHISDLEEPEHFLEKAKWNKLLEIYSPIYLSRTNKIIAVSEFYQTITELEQEIFNAQIISWVIIIVLALIMYFSLIGIFKQGQNTILNQKSELEIKVAELSKIFKQNSELNRKVSQAAFHTAEINELLLKRISSDIHDGPVQDLSFCLLNIDKAIKMSGKCTENDIRICQNVKLLNDMQNAMQNSLKELRIISSGLRLPELEPLTLEETIQKVINLHKLRSDTTAKLKLGKLPEKAPKPVKITLFRIIQEGLNNSNKHCGKVEQQVNVEVKNDYIYIEIKDKGRGFNISEIDYNDLSHLGLIGMRERVEILGGNFNIQSNDKTGTTISVSLPLSPV